MTKRSPQPFLWLLFSIGGMVTALLAPIFLLLFGIILPVGVPVPPDRQRLLVLLDYPLIRVALFGVCILALFHCAYRFYYVLRDGLRLKYPQGIIVTCYTSAIAGSVIVGYILFMQVRA